MLDKRDLGYTEEEKQILDKTMNLSLKSLREGVHLNSFFLIGYKNVTSGVLIKHYGPYYMLGPP